MPGYLLTDICRKYKTAKLSLLRRLLHLAKDQTNIQNFAECKVLELIKPFLSDSDFEVQNAAISLVIQIAEGGEGNAIMIIQSGIVQELLRDVSYKERFYQMSVFKALTNIGTHSESIASTVLDVGGLDFLNGILSSFDKLQLSYAVYTIGRLGAFPSTARKLTAPNGILHWFRCLLEDTDTNFLKAVISALGDIVFVSKSVAEYISGELFEAAARLLRNRDVELKERVLGFIARFAFHSAELSLEVLHNEMLQEMLACLENENGHVTRYAIDVFIQIAKQNNQTLKALIGAGLHDILSSIIKIQKNTDRRKCIELLGILANEEGTNADSIACQAILTLMPILKEDTDPETIVSVVWTLGEIAQNSKEIALRIVEDNLLPIIIENLMNPKSTKCYTVFMQTYKKVFDNCAHHHLIEIFLIDNIESLPIPIVEHATISLSKYLPFKTTARMKFLESGAIIRLMCLQHIKSKSFLTGRQNIMACYPETTLRDIQLRLTRDEGMRWEELAPYLVPHARGGGEGEVEGKVGAEREATTAWMPRPLRFVPCERAPTPPSSPRARLISTRLSDTGVKAAAAARRAAKQASEAITAKMVMDEAVAIATGGSPRPAEPPAPKSLTVPRLVPGEDLGPLPTRFTCPTCCRLITTVDDTCCKNLDEGVDPDRVCHLVPQRIPDSEIEPGGGGGGGDSDDDDDFDFDSDFDFDNQFPKTKESELSPEMMMDLELHREMDAHFPFHGPERDISLKTITSKRVLQNSNTNTHPQSSVISILEPIPSSIMCCDLNTDQANKATDAAWKHDV